MGFRKKRNTDDDLEIMSVDDIDNGKEHGKQVKSAGSKIRIVIMAVSLIVFVVAGYQLYSIYHEYKLGENEYNDLDKYVHVAVNGQEEEWDGEEITDDDKPKSQSIMPYKKADVDFDGLKAINSEVVGWVQFEHVNISYPIVQHSDNEYYLKKTFKNKNNSAGSIFMEAGNKPTFEDMNTFIYGHNMKNGSMFGLLGQYKKESFYRQREFFWIYTPTADYRYEIFASYEPSEDSEMYTWWTGPCDAYGEYLKKAKKMSLYDTGVSVKKDDKIVTLSTCTNKGKTYRFVVQGKLVKVVKR